MKRSSLFLSAGGIAFRVSFLAGTLWIVAGCDKAVAPQAKQRGDSNSSNSDGRPFGTDLAKSDSPSTTQPTQSQPPPAAGISKPNPGAAPREPGLAAPGPAGHQNNPGAAPANAGAKQPAAKPAFAPSGAVGFNIGDIAPDIEGPDLDGEQFRLSDYRGKVVVLDFWGDW